MLRFRAAPLAFGLLLLGCSCEDSPNLFIPPVPDGGIEASEAAADVRLLEGGPDGAEGGGGTGGLADTGLVPDATDGRADASGCPTLSFASPTKATLDERDDVDGSCANGFQVNVRVATTDPSVSARLGVNGTEIGEGPVSAFGAVIAFDSVELPPNSASTLAVIIDGRPECSGIATVTVACPDASTSADAGDAPDGDAKMDASEAGDGDAAAQPICTISEPSISPTHPKLNGVAAPLGDRVSAPSSPYQAAFEVTTDLPDGSSVTLALDGVTTYAATVSSGKALFAGVALDEGDTEVQASCVGTSASSKSTETTFSVDFTLPDIAAASPVDGHHYGPADDADGNGGNDLQFDVCVTTSVADALDLPASLGSGQSNFCVAIGVQTPVCASATTGGDGSGGNGGCVRLTCPGIAPFDLQLTLRDGAGNETTDTLSSITCASSKPSVQIVSPADGSDPADIATHILAFGSQAVADLSAGSAGAQYDVTACTSADVGASAELFSGLDGGAMASVAVVSVTASTPADNCPPGYPNAARFLGATLPQSTTDSSGALDTLTALRVDVTDASTEVGTSGDLLVWVDSIAPNLSPTSPSPLCGIVIPPSSNPLDITVISNASGVDLTVSLPSGGTGSYPGTPGSFTGQFKFLGVALEAGTNGLAMTAAEPSGNVTNLQQPCDVFVGTPPTVAWIAPTAVSNFNASTDGTSGGTASDPGWQGLLQVQVTTGYEAGMTVQFRINGSDYGSLVVVDSGTHLASLLADVPEGDPVTLTAITSTASTGVGQASLSGLVVDVTPPSDPTVLSVSVKTRRQTTFNLAWTAGGDGTNPRAFGYQIRFAKGTNPIDTTGEFNAATSATYVGTPSLGGAPDSVDVKDRLIETDYVFALRAVDKAGNTSNILSASAIRAHFNLAVLKGTTANAEFGSQALDGSSNLDKDPSSLADLVVGEDAGNKVYLWFGKAAGWAQTNQAPDVVISGPSGVFFGTGVAAVGDVDGDGNDDIAISAPAQGKIYVVPGYGSGAWPATIDAVSAPHYEIVLGATFNFPGTWLTRLGDFDGDGNDDFAFDVPYWDSFAHAYGYVVIVRGASGVGPDVFPATVNIPADVGIGKRAWGIPGESTIGASHFGEPVHGLGPVYGSLGDLLVGASWGPGAGPNRVYSFQGRVGTGGTLSPTADVSDTLSRDERFGFSFGLLGDISSKYGVAVDAPESATHNGMASVFFGDSSALLTGEVTIFDSTSTSTNDRFGQVLAGSRASGQALQRNILGNSKPDLAIAGFHHVTAAPKVYFLDGERLFAQIGNSLDVSTFADTSLDLASLGGHPEGTSLDFSDWKGSSRGSGPIADLDGDGFGDMVIGESDMEWGGATLYDGRAIVIW